jgi:hypothetical protein
MAYIPIRHVGYGAKAMISLLSPVAPQTHEGHKTCAHTFQDTIQSVSVTLE